jgi:hypothetical protein
MTKNIHESRVATRGFFRPQDEFACLFGPPLKFGAAHPRNLRFFGAVSLIGA